MKSSLMLFRSVFFSRFQSVTLIVFLLWATQILGSDSLQTRNNAPVVQSNLAVRLNTFLTRTEEIRIVLLRIANEANNEGVQGADKIYEAVLEAGETITLVRERVNDLTSRLDLNTMPFPSGIHIKGFPITVPGQGIWKKRWTLNFPDIDATIHGFPPQIPPNLTSTLLRFLDLVDQPLSFALQAVQDMDNQMTKSLAAVRSSAEYPTFSSRSDSFPEAHYFYPEKIRKWLGNPVVVVAANVLAAYFEGFQNMMVDIGDQDLELVGEGGNLSLPVRFVPTKLKKITSLLKVLINHIASDASRAENSASYVREEHIHGDIEVLDGKFEEWRTLSIRTRIEINLAGHGDHPHPIAIFQLPTQFGGYLELARDIVQETINNMLAAGQNVHKAVMYHSRGNDKFAAGEYKKAYRYYSKSYREATKEDHEDHED